MAIVDASARSRLGSASEDVVEFGTSILAPTPPERLVDARGRPYFLWDSEMDIATFRARIADPDPDVRAYYIGKLMRQAKPDDVFTFVDSATIRANWDEIEPYLGARRPARGGESSSSRARASLAPVAQRCDDAASILS